MNINNVELERPYKWKELCEALEIKVSEGNSRKKDLRKLESLCRFTKEGQKFIIHEKYETPLEIKETRGGANNHSNKYESLEESLELAIARKLTDIDIQEYEDRSKNPPSRFGEGFKDYHCCIYMFGIDIYEELGMVNSEYRTNRTKFDKTRIKNKLVENFTLEDYKNNKWDRKGDLSMEYNKYLNEQAELFNEDFYNQFKKRESEILNTALNRLSQKRLIQKNYCYCLLYEKEMVDKDGNLVLDENGNTMYETMTEYTNPRETQYLENAQATILNMWDLKDKNNKKYRTVAELPSYLLPRLNKDTLEILNKDTMKKQEEYNEYLWKIKSYYRAYEIRIADVALERFVRLSKEPKLESKEDYNLKNINNVVTLSVAKTLSNVCEKAKKGEVQKGKNKFLEVRANNKDLYVEYVKENCGICEFLTDETIEELIKLKGDK